MTILFCSSLMMSKDYFLSNGYFQRATKCIHVSWWPESILVGIAGSPWYFVGFPDSLWACSSLSKLIRLKWSEIKWGGFQIL